MRRLAFVLLSGIFIANGLLAQAPQFAVVRPDGTTFICPTFDSAYNRAVNGDNIYLPGGSFTSASNIMISKKLFIYGAGHYPDSTSTTGITACQQDLNIIKGADEGSIEGIHFISNIFFGTGVNGANKANVQNYTIKRCRVNNNIILNSSIYPNTASPDSLPSNIMINENIFGSMYATYGYSINNVLAKNIIISATQSLKYCTFNNNIFLTSTGTPIPIVNCDFNNNIFCSGSNFSQCTNIFYNNLKVGSANFLQTCAPGDGIQSGNISVPSVSDIFISYTGNGNFSYTDNYHLKPGCPGINAGTDGTDVGIYGTLQPTSQGWVPSNPHIYFKQIAPQTNASGQLPIQFKVRTNN